MSHTAEEYREAAQDMMEVSASLADGDQQLVRYEIVPMLREAAEMREALGKLVVKVEAVDKATFGIFVLAKAHGMEYDGPSYYEELVRARAILGGNDED